MIAVGERRWPDPALPPEEALEVMQADFIAAAAEVDLAVLTRAAADHPRRPAELASGHHPDGQRDPGRGQLLSPFGTWDLAGPWDRGLHRRPRRPTIAVGDTVAARLGAARTTLVGAGQGDVLRPGPLQPGHTNQYRRRLETTTLPANNVR